MILIIHPGTITNINGKVITERPLLTMEIIISTSVNVIA